MIEIGRVPLSRITPLGEGKLFQQKHVVGVITEAGQWHYSAEAVFDLPGIQHGQRVVNIRVAVESGKLGIGWLNADGSAWVDRVFSEPTAEPIDLTIVIPEGTVGGKLVFENATEGGRPAVALVEGINIVKANIPLTKEILARYERGYAPYSSQIETLEKTAKELENGEFLALSPPVSILQNFAQNIWEFAHGETTLTSYPWNISLPVADVCNARCTFCTSWLDGRKVLDINTLDMFEPVLRNALFIGLVGHGEPMAHPRFDELCNRLESMCNPLSSLYTITNGIFLEKWRNHLERINLHSFSVSLNAATSETHDAVMGLGPDAFPRIVDSMARLIELGNKVNITMVVTQQNLAEIASFIELGNRLGVEAIWLRSLLPQANLIPGLNYHLVPPYLHPDFEPLRRSAVAAIQTSRVTVQADPGAWGQRIFPEALEQQILFKPPPTTSREQALRDRELRGRNEYLYRQDKGIFRGRPLESGATASVRWAEGRVHVATPKGSGAYAAAVEVTYPGATEQGLRVEAQVDCEAGALGLGLLDEANNTWLDRVLVQRGTGQTTVLETSATGQKIQLVIHNGGDGSTPARGSIGDVRIKVDGIGPSLPIEWGTLTLHNGADPLDDGTNPLDRHPRFACKAVYYNLYINEFFYRVNPCCYLQQTPGFEEVRLDGDMTFMEAWNSPGMVELRRRLSEGPLFGACMRCPEKW